MKAVIACFLFGALAWGQGYKPGDFQTSNPSYPKRNPFYFEGRVDWEILKIDQPANAWEFAQRGIHKQDDLEDIPGAVADYRRSLSLNSLKEGSCQLILKAPAGFGQSVDPPPCMLTVRLRLANLLKISEPGTAILLLSEAAQIDPLRLGVNALKGEIYAGMGLSDQAITAYRAELALSPVTELSKRFTGDEANNAHVHWALAGIYKRTEQPDQEAAELELYLQATKWHSDTYPWRIQVARTRLDRFRPKSTMSRP